MSEIKINPKHPVPKTDRKKQSNPPDKKEFEKELEKKKKESSAKKVIEALGLLCKAAEILREAKEIERAKCNGSMVGSLAYFEGEIRQIIMSDHGQAGLEPFSRKI